MGFSKSRMPVKSFQVMSRRRVTWRDFIVISDLEKPILTLPNHWIDIPGKKVNQTRSNVIKTCDIKNDKVPVMRQSSDEEVRVWVFPHHECK